MGTNWMHPLYELPFTGGFPDTLGGVPDALADGEIGKLQSIIPGSGPSGIRNNPTAYGDDPTLPRDPDKFDGARRFSAGVPLQEHTKRISSRNLSRCL